MDNVAYLQTMWQTLWQQTPRLAPELAPIIAAYQQPQRHYHTTQHLRECLQYWHTCQQAMPNAFAIGVALFYHDVVYEPQRQDNETQSVAWMHHHLQDALDPHTLQTIATLIMDTQNHQASLGEISAWMLDIDLSILGANARRFAEYEAQIRQEYRFVPAMLYRYRRRQVLQTLAQRSPLFQTPYFQQQLGAQAQINLSGL
ncbi:MULTISPECIES: HD domain-containing protein [Vitreoscilla]|uniref:N-methyl-D-aspartate receptor NMDAR2C subunit n=1 Tax=Vitreoscilla stercoraria TaxID=61 RepID=A0ABY4E8G4_VITST|nr:MULTISPECIES: hypothetical protein [Vitreoscilla]AUZ04574.2 hypothetical protein ADP71_08330 [Vitreoscilla sp. C1]UOO91724.1 hypothetical protein LVJ81_08750 [Vitreoscilla stercoraria]